MKANVENLIECKGLHKYRKEHAFIREIAVLDPKDGSAIVTARIYWPGTVAYACLWVYGDNVYGSGAGKAGGYGYHKESAALAEAIGRAGIVLDKLISGCGDGAMRDACLAIAEAVTGKDKFFIHEAHS